MAEKAMAFFPKKRQAITARKRQELYEQISFIEGLFTDKMPEVLAPTDSSREAFLGDFEKAVGSNRANYIETIQSLPAAISSKGVIWLNGIVDALSTKVAAVCSGPGFIQKMIVK